MKKAIFTIILLMGLVTLNAQSGNSKIKFDLSVRYRFELWKGMNAKNYGDNSPAAIGKLNDKILYQRVITGLTFVPHANLTFAFHMQDSRAFGWSLRNSLYPDLFKIRKPGTQTPYYTMNPNEEFFEIYDAYIEYDHLFKDLSLKLGRQKIFYGDTRIFGPGEWGNTGRWTWDALKVSYRRGENFVDLFAGGTKIHDPEKISIPFTQTEFWGGGMYSHISFPKIMNIEPFYVLKTEGSADYINTLEFSRNWTGIRIFNNDFYHFVLDLTAVKEFGSESGKKTDAYGWFAKAGYQFLNLPAKPIISLRESYASGGKKTDAEIHTFDPAYGASDMYYGRMNILTWSNLDDREIVLELVPVKDMWIEMKYNRFYIPVPDDVTLLNTMKLEPGKHHLGDEFDAFIRYQVVKHWQLTSAFGYFIPGELSPINGGPAKNAEWFALQVLFTF
jgi:Alginate export